MAMTWSEIRYEKRSSATSARYSSGFGSPGRARYISGERSCWSKITRAPSSLCTAPMTLSVSGGLCMWTSAKRPRRASRSDSPSISAVAAPHSAT